MVNAPAKNALSLKRPALPWEIAKKMDLVKFGGGGGGGTIKSLARGGAESCS